jgi:hypothetical protein
MPEGYRARPEQAILFTVSAWDANCPQHIPLRFEAADVAAALAEREPSELAAFAVNVARARNMLFCIVISGQATSLPRLLQGLFLVQRQVAGRHRRISWGDHNRSTPA